VSHPAPPLPGPFHALAPALNHYGYLAVALLVFLEDFGVPLPGETILVAAAVYAGAGRLNIVAVGLIAVAAAIAGDNVGYAIGRSAGRAAILRWGRYVRLTARRLDAAEAFFTRHGGKIVTVARFIDGLRQANGLIAGLVEMRWWRFLAFNALGALLWVAVWTAVGDVAGSHLDALYHRLSGYELHLLVAVAALIVVAVVYRVLRRRAREQRAEAAGASPAAGEEDAEPPAARHAEPRRPGNRRPPT
jgi:membrane protein DedA with SNARE-associated domain